MFMIRPIITGLNLVFYEQHKDVSSKFYGPVLLANLARLKQIGPKCYENRRNWQCFSNIFNLDSHFVLYCAVLFFEHREHLVDELSASSSALLFKTSHESSGNVCSWHTVFTILWAAGSKQKFMRYQGSQGNTSNTATVITDNWNDYRNISLWNALSRRKPLFSEFPRCSCRWEGNFLPFPHALWNDI